MDIFNIYLSLNISQILTKDSVTVFVNAIMYYKEGALNLVSLVVKCCDYSR